jgi:outer membrane protein assembly factor BamB
VTDGEVKVKEEYFEGDLKNKHGGVVVVNGRVYGDSNDSGFPFCADVKTGKLIWKKKDRTPGGGSAAITYADGHLYILYDNGYLALVDIGERVYKEVSGFKLPNPRGPSWAHPVVAGGKLYVRQADTLYCFDIKQP